MAGVAARLAALPAWAQAEHAAAAAQTEGRGLAVVWALRKAELITFVMHQLRDSAAGPDFCAAAWGRLRAALRPFANRAAGLTFCARRGTIKRKRRRFSCMRCTCRGPMPTFRTRRKNC